MPSRKQSTDGPRPILDDRSAADWLAEAERFARMAEHLKGNPELSERFQLLATDARERAAHMSG
jgi:hypothetical protein